MPYYSFVILCYNNWEMSQQAITTLINSLSDEDKTKGVELIIIDNGSTDKTAEGIKKLKKKYQNSSIQIISLKLKENMGYPVGINLGLANCSGQIITTLNNDLIFPPNWFDSLARALKNNQQIGVAVPYLSSASGPQNVGVKLDSLQEIYDFARDLMKNNEGEISYTHRVIGACLVFKREVIEKIGGNDFWFGIGICDDDDLSLRAALAGYKLAIVEDSFIYHLGTVTFKQKVHELNCALAANHRKFSLKWSLAPHGKYESRKTLIEDIDYNKQKHYFPLKIEDFNPPTPPIIKEDTEKKLLLAADWNNDKSAWKEKLASILKEDFKRELYFWIPRKYFLVDQITAEIKETIETKQFDLTSANFFYQNIAPINLLRFLNSFDCILKVDNDFVNRYISYLAEKISTPTN